MGDKLPANLADNWDLHAVVNCFSTKNYTPPQINTTTTVTAAAADESSSESDPLAFLANMKFDEDEDDHGPFSFPILLENNNNNNNNVYGLDELQDSYRPFFPTPSFFIPDQQLINTSTVSPMNSSIPPPFVFGEQNNQQTHHVQQNLQQQQQPMPTSSAIPLPSNPMMPSQAPRSRKSYRRTPIKKMVCQVKFEHLSVDTWGWRKYGQKPIKGSPYPRNYYRCSSSKGCGARKQVERSNTDPSSYIVSYTGDHSHPRPTQRNSLAGSTRNKFTRTKPTLPPTNIAADSSSSSSHLAATCQSPTTSPQPAPTVLLEEMNDDSIEKEEEEEDVDDLFEDILIPNLAAPAIDEDFFKGLKHFGTAAASGSGGNDSL